jgi:hypothetical protein
MEAKFLIHFPFRSDFLFFLEIGGIANKNRPDFSFLEIGTGLTSIRSTNSWAPAAKAYGF